MRRQAVLLVLVSLLDFRLAALTPPTNGAGVGMSEEEQMAWLASGVYKFRTPIAGWTLEEKLVLISGCFAEPDNFAIYRHAEANKCALAIAGTDSVADMLDNFDGRTTEDCGFTDIHFGYMKEVNDLLRACDFNNKFKPLLASSKCSGGIALVGHSLGGGVASVFAACANNPTTPYGFNVTSLWTFGAPAVSKKPLHDARASDGCFAGKRIWNQDRIGLDPIPGMSRGLNFVHPRIPAVRLREKTFFLMGTGEYEEETYTCGSWQSYEKPDPLDGTPWATMHMMTAYTERARKKYTGSFTEKTGVKETAVNTKGQCTINQTFTYQTLKQYPVGKSGFHGWGHSVAGYVTNYFIAIACVIAAIWGFRRMQLARKTKEGLSQYDDEHQVYEFLEEVQIELIKERPQDILKWLEDYVHKKHEDTTCPLNLECKKARAQNSRQQLNSPIYLCMRWCGCKRKRKSGLRNRSPDVQFFAFVVLQGLSKFFAGVAHHTLNYYYHNDHVMGRHWGEPNSAWMVPWTLGVVFASPAIMTSFALMLTFLKHSDWTVKWAHIVGVMFACLELQLMIVENLSNTGKASGVLALVASSCATVELAVHIFRHRSERFQQADIKWLCAGIGILFVGYFVWTYMPCEQPHNKECPLPEKFNANAVFHVFLLADVIVISIAMWFRKKKEEEASVTPVTGDEAVDGHVVSSTLVRVVCSNS